MNTYNINDEAFYNSSEYQEYLKQNPGKGMLKIRAYGASEAIPVKGLKIIVNGDINGKKVVFYEGYTDESGSINNIVLPAPSLNDNNLESPAKAVYEILATYFPDNITKVYKINMFDDVCVIQNISIVPDASIERGWSKWL